MVKRIETWEASDGVKFESKADALQHELFLIVRPMLENDALATKFVGAMTPERSAALVEVLSDAAA